MIRLPFGRTPANQSHSRNTFYFFLIVCHLSRKASIRVVPAWQLMSTIWDGSFYGGTVLCLAAQSCPTLHNPMGCSPPGSSIHGILQARTLEWEAYPFSRGSSPPRNWTRVSYIAGGFFTSWATRKAPFIYTPRPTAHKYGKPTHQCVCAHLHDIL